MRAIKKITGVLAIAATGLLGFSIPANAQGIDVAGSAVSGRAAATPASAALDLSANVCTGTEVVTYTPGITNTSQSVTRNVQGNLGTPLHCTDPAAPTGTYTELTNNVVTSCTDLLTLSTGTRILHWSGGESSTFPFVRTVTRANGNVVVTHTGTIGSGMYASHPATLAITIPETQLAACSTQLGVTQLTGVSTLTIV